MCSNLVIYCIISNNDSSISRLRWIMQSPKLKGKKGRKILSASVVGNRRKKYKKNKDRRKYGNSMFHLYTTGIQTIIKPTIKKRNHVLISNSNLSPFIEYYTYVFKFDRNNCCFRSRT